LDQEEHNAGSLAIAILDPTTGRAVEVELLDGLAPEDLMLLESEWVSERSRIMQELLRADSRSLINL
jgi:streptogramin lyase